MNGYKTPCSIGIIAAVWLALAPLPAAAQAVRERYTALQAREQQVLELIAATEPSAPADARDRVLRQGRSVVAAYAALATRYRASGYADNALWNAAAIADAMYARFQRVSDQALAERYSTRLAAEYPTSSLLKKKPETARASAPRVTSLPASAPVPAAPVSPPAVAAVASATPESRTPSPSRAMLTGIQRTLLPEGVRITMSLDQEVPYREQRLSGPERVFFDLKDVRTTPELRDAVLRYTSAAVRQIRVGRHPNDTVRVVLDLEGVSKYSVFTLYNPFRLVVDAETGTAAAASPATLRAAAVAAPLVSSDFIGPSLDSPTSRPTEIRAATTVKPVAVSAEPPVTITDTTVPENSAENSRHPAAASAPASAPAESRGAAAGKPVASASAPADAGGDSADKPIAPVPPRSNAAGGFSLSRQLGLGVARIVIDPGHGGHDPGAQGKGLNEADLTLDVALRLERLLQSDGLEVVLTRRADVYVPLEERTAIANREGADLFLSIHANASRNAEARGVESYFLSFASSPEAEAVAARENSAASSAMHDLSDIIRAIALNNKLDESRDFASMVQEAMVTRLRRSNKDLRNIGVKKAPFVVLIGAQMPSVLAEMSFLTNRQELQLLKTNAYKQRIAEALHAAVVRYRRSLKGQSHIAEK